MMRDEFLGIIYKLFFDIGFAIFFYKIKLLINLMEFDGTNEEHRW
jgi:hypothetical protein